MHAIANPSAGLTYLVTQTPLLDKLGPHERLALAQTNRELHQALRERGGLCAAAAALTHERFLAGEPAERLRLDPRLPPLCNVACGATCLNLSPSHRYLAVGLPTYTAVHDLQMPNVAPFVVPSDGLLLWLPMQDLLLVQSHAAQSIVAPNPHAGHHNIHGQQHVLSTTDSGAWLHKRSHAAWSDCGEQIITCEHPGHLVSVQVATQRKRSVWIVDPADCPMQRFVVSPSGARMFVETAGAYYIIATHTGLSQRCAAPASFCMPRWVDNERAIAFCTRIGATVVHANDGTLRHHIATGVAWPLSEVSPTGNKRALNPP